jgi:hypothetical protein
VSTLFISMSVFWLYYYLFNNQESYATFFTNTYGLIALLGGIFGIFIAEKWGGFRSYLGTSVLFFSFGLLLQEIGQIFYIYYIYIQRIEIPYPSLGDVGFFGSIPMYVLGAFYLGKVLGLGKHTLGSLKNVLISALVFLAVLSLAYFTLIRPYEYNFSDPAKAFLDFGYPIGHAVYLAVGLLVYFISQKSLGGSLRKNVLFIICTLTLQYVADFVFLYKARDGSWIPGGPNDFMYFIAYYAMALSILSLSSVFERLKSGRITNGGTVN